MWKSTLLDSPKIILTCLQTNKYRPDICTEEQHVSSSCYKGILKASI